MTMLYETTLGAILAYFRRDPDGFDAWWWRLPEGERQEILAMLRAADALGEAMLARLEADPPERAN